MIIKKIKRDLTAVVALLFTISLTTTVVINENEIVGHSTFATSKATIINTVDNNYYTSNFDSWQKQYANAENLIKDIQEEGSVLLQNRGVLPIEQNKKVSIIYVSEKRMVYGGTGSGRVDASTALDLETAMKKTAFKISSEEDDSDTAIVVLSRNSGEGRDLSVKNKYLELQDSEKEQLLNINKQYKNIILLVNSGNPVSLHRLEDYGVDACLWIGLPGQTGLQSVAEILSGKRNPSGKLSDTYASSSLSSPAIQNFGDYTYTNAAYIDDSISYGQVGALHTLYGESNQHYIVEAEGIYVGYKYYETRYEDCVLKQGNASSSEGIFLSQDNWNYKDEVDYSFGYGMSYSTFEQTLEKVEIDEVLETAVITVKVKNISNVPGKDVVQIYAQSPYTEYDKENLVEKSAIQLAGFIKTDSLQPNESQIVNIEIELRNLASYDRNGYGSYIMEAGDYYFSIGNGAHDALNNILALKGKNVSDGMDYDGNANMAYRWTKSETDTTTYSISSTTSYEINNQFDKADLNYYGKDKITYISRQDWEETWPKSYENLTATEEMINDLNLVQKESGNRDTSSITYGADNGLSIISLKDSVYNDKRWELLLDQMTLEEQSRLIGTSASHTEPIESINYPGSIDSDGPAGMSQRNYYDNPDDVSTVTDTPGIAYTAAVVLASTWNVELAYEQGRSIGEDALWVNAQSWYSPAMNIHRTPYGGRNFEYFSEDGILSGYIAEYEVKGCNSKGLLPHLKHFAFNEQDTNRFGVSTFMNEQAIRELYLKPFEYAVTKGEASGVMSSYVRIGTTWVGASYSLLTEVLRNEWGFRGQVITDCILSGYTYDNVRDGVLAGNNLWLTTNKEVVRGLEKYAKNDLELRLAIREACHEILYAATKSSAMNGLSETTQVVISNTWWQNILLVSNLFFGIATLICIIISIYTKSIMKNNLKITGIKAYAPVFFSVLAFILYATIRGKYAISCIFIFLIIGMMVSIISNIYNSKMMRYIALFIYFNTFSIFVNAEVYTVTNVMAGIDVRELDRVFVILLFVIICLIVTSMIATFENNFFKEGK